MEWNGKIDILAGNEEIPGIRRSLHETDNQTEILTEPVLYGPTDLANRDRKAGERIWGKEMEQIGKIEISELKEFLAQGEVSMRQTIRQKY